MGLIALLKYAVNNSVGTTYFKPLDVMLGAKIVCRGRLGTSFTINDQDGIYGPFTVSITEEDKYYNEADRMRYKIIPVPLGTYSINIALDGVTTTATVSVATTGKHYFFAYTLKSVLQTFTANGTFTIPDVGQFDLYLTAAGGGGGGSGGHTSNGSGGAGGGGGACIYMQRVLKTVGDAISITLGAAGSGGARFAAGTAGGSTVVGDIITLAGGQGGAVASGGTSGAAGGAAGSGGGKGGNGANGSSIMGQAGDDSIIPGGSGGAGGSSSASQPYWTGGGGGGGYGPGGKGGVDSTAATAGGYGAGGGGASYGSQTGKDGGKGIAEFLKGVIVA